MHTRCATLIAAFCLLFPPVSFAGTGILEVLSEPAGARIWIDSVDSGTTPYQNLEMPAGKHRIRAVLSDEFPGQDQEVLVDEKSPQTVLFKFEHSRGKFIGQEIVRTVSKFKGNVTFASVPTGAAVVLNGESIRRTTPIGYTDVEVGRYSVEFRLEGRTLKTDFQVAQGETVKLIADFAAGKVINKWEEARLRQDAEKGAVKRDAGLPEAPGNSGNKARQAEHAPQETSAPPGVSTPPAVPGPETGTFPAVPKPAPAGPPYGELLITMNVTRDADLKYSDFLDIAFPKVPIDALSGPAFPAASANSDSAFSDNFEYTNDAATNTRRFTARIDFGTRDTGPGEGRARSSVMTVREGTYDLKLVRRRMADRFYSVDKILDATAQEAIEIVRGNRLVVQIDSHISAENKLSYDLKRSYEDLSKSKPAAGKDDAKKSGQEVDYRSLPLFTGGQN